MGWVKSVARVPAPAGGAHILYSVTRYPCQPLRERIFWTTCQRSLDFTTKAIGPLRGGQREGVVHDCNVPFSAPPPSGSRHPGERERQTRTKRRAEQRGRSDRSDADMGS